MKIDQYELITGDALEVLRTLPDSHIQCCVTSPPYWGLRDYGVIGQIGLEPTPEEYVNRLVDVFREVRRVLADDGTMWLNLGDCYNTTPPGNKNPMSKSGLNGAQTSQRYKERLIETQQRQQEGRKLLREMKPKDLVGIPWMVAFALRADGWYLRSDIIWHKPNAMPESVKDRPTKAHEYLFLLSKGQRYYYDAEAIKEPAINGEKFHGAYDKPGIIRATATKNGRARADNKTATRNKRTVWNVNTKSFKGAHFAVFPPALVEPCILAGSKPGDIVLDPFAGASTTGLVAIQHGRKFIGIELNPDYIELSKKRIEGVI